MLAAQLSQEIIDRTPGQMQNGRCAKFSAGSGNAFLADKELSQQCAVGF